MSENHEKAIEMTSKPLTQIPALRNVVNRNRWRDVFDGTVPDDWEPTLKVSVVTPAYNSKTLDLTLASLAAQDYPEHLLEVVVIDDGSIPAVEIGKYAPKNTRLIRVQDDQGWGRSNALRIGIDATDGEIIYWVDSDMILFSNNVREHAKYAHFIPEAATIGHKGFVEEWDFTPEQVYNEVKTDEIRKHHDLSTLHRHWSLDIFDETDDLNSSGGRNYSTHMGACATVTRSVYERTHGQDPTMKLGDDTEIAYQMWQRGAVFIPVQSAETYHLGKATVSVSGEQVTNINNIHFAQRMPIPRYRRRATNRQWTVPYITAVVKVDLETATVARECVDRLLNQTETDLQVVLVGPWSELHDGRRRVLADPNTELYLLQEWYRNEGRVTLVEDEPEDVFPSPYRLDVPPTVGLESTAVQKIMRITFGEDLGEVNFFPPAGNETSNAVKIIYTPALSRAQRYVSDEVPYVEAMHAAWGLEWKSGIEDNMFDLRTTEPAERIGRAETEKMGELRKRIQRVRRRAEAAEENLRNLQEAVERQRFRNLARRGGRKILREVRERRSR